MPKGGGCTAVVSFTLAEVLIVLGIIGLIADMTIPTLIHSTRDKITVVQTKKFYSGFENAYRLAISQEGTPDNWNLIAKDSREGAMNFVKKMEPYLKISKNCGIDGGCFFNGNYKNLDGGIGGNYSLPSWGWSTFQLSDGTSVLIQIASPDCSHNDPKEDVCAWVFVDINGFKKPNTSGMDFFTFYLTKNNLIPFGLESDGQFEEDCIKRIYGNSCVGWIIYNENMDYLKCNDLSWNGRRKCD